MVAGHLRVPRKRGIGVIGSQPIAGERHGQSTRLTTWLRGRLHLHGVARCRLLAEILEVGRNWKDPKQTDQGEGQQVRIDTAGSHSPELSYVC